jgi:hypothetical protein
MKFNLMLRDLSLGHGAKMTNPALWRILSPVKLQVHVLATVILVVEAETAGVAFVLWERVACHLTVLIASFPPRVEELVAVGAVVSHDWISISILCCNQFGSFDSVQGRLRSLLTWQIDSEGFGAAIAEIRSAQSFMVKFDSILVVYSTLIPSL